MFAAWQDDNREQFWAEALCNDGAGSLVALFFSEQLDDIARAKSICGECTVRVECFEGALARRQLFLNGKVLAHKRPRGRPRKHPLPDTQIAS